MPDTGSLREISKRSPGAPTSTDNQFDAQVMIGLITALAHDAELRQVFRERLIDPQVADSMRYSNGRCLEARCLKTAISISWCRCSRRS